MENIDSFKIVFYIATSDITRNGGRSKIVAFSLFSIFPNKYRSPFAVEKLSVNTDFPPCDMVGTLFGLWGTERIIRSCYQYRAADIWLCTDGFIQKYSFLFFFRLFFFNLFVLLYFLSIEQRSNLRIYY